MNTNSNVENVFYEDVPPGTLDEEDFFCTEKIVPRKIKPQNIVIRLMDREIYGSRKPGSHFHVVREFYQNVFPNLTIVNVEKPPCFLRKFSPDGKHFIAFSADQTSLEVFFIIKLIFNEKIIKKTNKFMSFCLYYINKCITLYN